jgi:FixJ family two-component response regulator
LVISDEDNHPRWLLERERPTAIVFVCAHDDPTMQAIVLQSGAIAFLKKPFENRALIRAIDTAIT